MTNEWVSSLGSLQSSNIYILFNVCSVERFKLNWSNRVEWLKGIYLCWMLSLMCLWVWETLNRLSQFLFVGIAYYNLLYDRVSPPSFIVFVFERSLWMEHSLNVHTHTNVSTVLNLFTLLLNTVCFNIRHDSATGELPIDGKQSVSQSNFGASLGWCPYMVRYL